MNNNLHTSETEIGQKILIDEDELKRLYRQIAAHQATIEHYQRLEQEWKDSSTTETHQLNCE